MPKFENPWPSFHLPSVKDIASSISVRPRQTGPSLSGGTIRTPKTQVAQFKADVEDDDDVHVTWLGHASVYLRIPLPRTASARSSMLQANRQRASLSGSMIGVLFDPVFSRRCSPVAWLGPERRLELPCAVEDLPGVHVVNISHDHYDHLDKKSIQDIERYHGHTVQYFVPTGVKRIMIRFGVPACKVHELAWWEDVTLTLSPANIGVARGGISTGAQGNEEAEPVQSPISPSVPIVTKTVYMSASSERKSQPTSIDEETGEELSPISIGSDDFFTPASRVCFHHKSTEDPIDHQMATSVRSPGIDHDGQGYLRIACTPSQHNSGRMPFKQNRTLWAGWFLTCSTGQLREFRCFFGGDTGYRSMTRKGSEVCPAFREIREKYGSPDLALLPIAAGSVLPYISSLLPTCIKLDHYKLTSATHASPADALDMHADLTGSMGFGWMMPIHYATFASRAGARDNSEQLEMACRTRGVRHEWAERVLQGTRTKSAGDRGCNVSITRPAQSGVIGVEGSVDGEKVKVGQLSPELAVKGETAVTGNRGVLLSDIGVKISIPLRHGIRGLTTTNLKTEMVIT
ncbi:hypothetical protein IAT40_004804 [Kwoniella sp. CBS 6097]